MDKKFEGNFLKISQLAAGKTAMEASWNSTLGLSLDRFLCWKHEANVKDLEKQFSQNTILSFHSLYSVLKINYWIKIHIILKNLLFYDISLLFIPIFTVCLLCALIRSFLLQMISPLVKRIDYT